MMYLFLFLAGLAGAASYDGLKWLRTHLRTTNRSLDAIFADEMLRSMSAPKRANAADEVAALHGLYGAKIDELLGVPVISSRNPLVDGRVIVMGSALADAIRPAGETYSLGPVDDVHLFTHDADNLLTHGDTGELFHTSNPKPPGLLAELMTHPPAGAHAVDEQPNAFESAWLDEQVPARPVPLPCTGGVACVAGVHFPGTARLRACEAISTAQVDESDDEHRARQEANRAAWWAGPRTPGEYGDTETTMTFGVGHGHGSFLDGPECDSGAGCRAELHRPSCAELNTDRITASFPDSTVSADLFEPPAPAIAALMDRALRDQFSSTELDRQAAGALRRSQLASE